MHNSQVNGHVDDVSDEEQTRASRNVKKEKKGNGKQRAAPEEQDEDAAAVDEDEEDEDDLIDVSNLPDQPLRRVDAQKLNGIAEDWRNMRLQIGQRVDIFKEVGVAMADAGEESFETSEVDISDASFDFELTPDFVHRICKRSTRL